MTSRQSGHAEKPLPSSSAASTSTSTSSSASSRPPSSTGPTSSPKLQVQRSLSRETLTIHFSALGKEEEEHEDELYGRAESVTPSSGSCLLAEVVASPEDDGSKIVEALEASEELEYEPDSVGADSTSGPTVTYSTFHPPSAAAPKGHGPPTAKLTMPSSLPFKKTTAPACTASPTTSTKTTPTTTKNTTAAVTKSSSPSRSISSSDKPFLSLLKSLSSDLEPRDGLPVGSTMRHRQLMKNFVKSLSSDTSQESLGSYRLSESRLLKQFTQSRGSGSASSSTTGATGDSKTAPSSPLTSPDSRFSFKPLSDMEARIEDTKRRFSEAISDPLQLLSKIIGDENANSTGSGVGLLYRPKGLSASASELSSLVSLNDHTESNNNYSIKEEDCDEDGNPNMEGDGEEGGVSASALSTSSSFVAEPQRPGVATPSVLEKCSMSLLAKQEDEEFCELYTEDFDFCNDLVTDGDNVYGDSSAIVSTSPCEAVLSAVGVCSEDELDGDEEDESAPSVPVKTLFGLTLLTYGYFLLPLPPYLGGMAFGGALGFMLAIGVVWLAGPKRSSGSAGRRKRREHQTWNMANYDVKEPGMFKGWMNEILNYNPETYHATLTHSVFVRLEASTLRLSRPNRNIPRRASVKESKPDVTYISQKIYDLTDSKIHLVPAHLARKRIWNKKYPICVELAKQDDFMAKAESQSQDEEQHPFAARSTSSTDLKSDGTISTEDYKKTGSEGRSLAGSTSRSQLTTLYLFGRTGREKEEWFQRLLQASKLKAEMARKAVTLTLSKSASILSHSRSGSRSSLDDMLATPARMWDSSGPNTAPTLPPTSSASGSNAAPSAIPIPVPIPVAFQARNRPELEYNVYMANCLPPPPDAQEQQQRDPGQVGSPSPNTPQQSPHSSPGATKKFLGSEEKEAESVAWVNALVGRVAWDFLRENYWADWVSKKIQMKLSKIRLPYFMNELTLTELDMGVATPRILQASMPSVDHRGLWFDLEICYTGSFLMTLETKLNLVRLGKEGEGFGELGKDGPRPRSYCLADSDEESSSAGSSDEEEPTELTADQTSGTDGFVGGHKASKIMRFVDKVTKSKYFQRATETEFIKKKMEEVSNTPLLLTVEVKECRGTLAVNIPPPPTDRIWYGFRTPPRLDLKARPKLGEREVAFIHVTERIEKKLYQEFQKILVMPNMDDVWLTIMHSATDPRSHPPASDRQSTPPQ